MQKAAFRLLMHVQGCKREMGHISAVYALGVDVAPTRQARAWLVERTISAMDFTCSAVQSDKVGFACAESYER